ncbi:EamA family transporter [Rhizobium sp. AG855]|uniref:EamA family transporter n=1 Tax=Rhizobium sp. AG855 TaxID=2183898 RepID=UPI000E735C70|nr:EamA family transporter [Rhizobium sp. AG855]RKE77392.1 multidrug transporter EmrE-like cation transporter [Rhizobium sp. AG855]
MNRLSAFWLAVPVLNTAQQLLLKQSALAISQTGETGWLAQLFVSPWFAGAILAEIVCFFIWMRVLSELDLAKAFPLSAISYVFILASAWLFFGEPVTIVEIGGSMLIMLGVWCLSSPSHSA